MVLWTFWCYSWVPACPGTFWVRGIRCSFFLQGGYCFVSFQTGWTSSCNNTIGCPRGSGQQDYQIIVDKSGNSCNFHYKKAVSNVFFCWLLLSFMSVMGYCNKKRDYVKGECLKLSNMCIKGDPPKNGFILKETWIRHRCFHQPQSPQSVRKACPIKLSLIKHLAFAEPKGTKAVQKWTYHVPYMDNMGHIK